MIKEINIGGAFFVLSNEGSNVRIKSFSENIILPNQSVEVISEILKQNLKIVISHYRQKINDNYNQFDENDIIQLSVLIVLYYLYRYNSWRNMYKKEANRDLKFIIADFDNISTFDIILNYFKRKYPDNWAFRCSLLLGLKLDDFMSKYQRRQEFYNK